MKQAFPIAGFVGAIAAASAHAQSSVTLYGTLDAGLVYSNNQRGHSNWQQASGSVSHTYWGLRGGEDLGGACLPPGGRALLRPDCEVCAKSDFLNQVYNLVF